VVVEKLKDRNYYGLGGTAIDGRDPANPYGGIWIDLGEGLCLHGSPQNPSGGSDQMGCISLSPIDAADVFGMLDRGSKVEIIGR
jgi:lipoprotein-anchoring transpeptidase ErfK/SrfK